MKYICLLIAVALISGCQGKTESQLRVEACYNRINAVIKAGNVGSAQEDCGKLTAAELEEVSVHVSKNNPGHKMSIERKVNQEKASTPSPSAPQKKAWSEATATNEGRRLFSLIGKAEEDLSSAVATGDLVGFRKYVTHPLSIEIQRWHDHEHPDRLSVCHDAAIALHGYAMTMYSEYLSGSSFDGVMVRRERKTYADLLKTSKAACAKAIKG